MQVKKLLTVSVVIGALLIAAIGIVAIEALAGPGEDTAPVVVSGQGEVSLEEVAPVRPTQAPPLSLGTTGDAAPVVVSGQEQVSLEEVAPVQPTQAPPLSLGTGGDAAPLVVSAPVKPKVTVYYNYTHTLWPAYKSGTSAKGKARTEMSQYPSYPPIYYSVDVWLWKWVGSEWEKVAHGSYHTVWPHSSCTAYATYSNATTAYYGTTSLHKGTFPDGTGAWYDRLVTNAVWLVFD